ncbi:MAG: UDP-3-O-acyl-N-acetylglucosamine deacetylase, partial [Sneathiella sp.]|nr:UDP-3-O-acyl-N-acetylglucosamine deacetylase [Sneathiella sp.]
RFIRIKKQVRVEDGDKWVNFEPFDGFKVAFTIDFDHPAFKEGTQTAEVDFSTTSFVREVSRALLFTRSSILSASLGYYVIQILINLSIRLPRKHLQIWSLKWIWL